MIVVDIGAGFIPFRVEGVRGGAETDDRFSGFQVVFKDIHLPIAWSTESGENGKEICGGDEFKIGEVVLVVETDVAWSWDPRRRGWCIESVTFSEDFGHHRHAFLGAILFVAGQNDVLFVAGAIIPLLHDPSLWQTQEWNLGVRS
ncbi:MAG: hypothetical protein M2R45_04403 [Verrucomicrobia subdivision 3 bacterium]|nr:hypothetical protein [Limisphaerales bacterium]MCS1417259.1 hypothetical protein [Limisphaerales bacterium]